MRRHLGLPRHHTANDGASTLLLVKHSSISTNPIEVYDQIFAFLGLGKTWSKLPSKAAEAATASVSAQLASPGGTHHAVNFRGGATGGSRYAQHLPHAASERICSMMRASPPVASLFLHAGAKTDCSRSEGHKRGPLTCVNSTAVKKTTLPAQPRPNISQLNASARGLSAAARGAYEILHPQKHVSAQLSPLDRRR